MVTEYERLGKPRIVKEYISEGREYVELDIYEGTTLSLPKKELYSESSDSIERKLE